MTKRSKAASTLFAVAAAAALGTVSFAHAGTDDARVARGRYLVSVSGCNDCHTPLAMGPNGPAPDTSRLLSGHPEALVMPPAPKLPEGPWAYLFAVSMTAATGPWGTTFSANLTPDPETGLGKWTEAQFLDTIHSGRHMGRGRPILPPMPIQNLQQMTDDDLKAIFAYLHTIPAVKNRVPDARPPAAAVAPAVAR